MRLAHRIRDLQALPYVVVMQEGVAKVYEVRPIVSRLADNETTVLFSCTGPRLRSMFALYSNLTFAALCSRLCRFPRIETLEDNERFCAFLGGLLDEQCVCTESP